MNSDWTFRLENLGGPLLFRVNGLPPEWMVDEVRVGDKDVTDAPYDVPTGGQDVSGVRIVITNFSSTLEGEVVDAEGRPNRDATVIVFPEDADLRTPGSRFSAVSQSNATGRFTVRNLPPGDYFVTARTSVIDGQWEDRSFLETLTGTSSRVTVSRGQTVTVRVQLQTVR